MDFLSLKLKSEVSRMRVVGSLQLSPPSVDLATSMAAVLKSAVADRLIKYPLPFGANVTHGSEARSRSPPLAAVPPEHVLKWAHECTGHVCPPSWETAATRP